MNKNVLKSPEVDSTGLRKMLDEISAQLSVSYLKKRASSNLHKQSALEELQDAITYLSEKEHELQVALNIAKYLIDCNEDLQTKLVRQKEHENVLIFEKKSLASEIKSYQRLLEEKDIKYENATLSLAQTEGELMKLSVDIQIGQSSKKHELSFADQDSFENELIEMQNEIDKHKRIN